MIKTLDKDILTVEEGIVIQCCNCVGGYGGLAGKIGQKWPIAKESYLYKLDSYQQAGIPNWTLLGSNKYVVVPDSEVTVVNMFTQYDIGMGSRKTEYGALYRCLSDVSVYAKDTDPIYMPWQLGCGLGGGDWELVENMINYVFRNRPEFTYICKI